MSHHLYASSKPPPQFFQVPAPSPPYPSGGTQLPGWHLAANTPFSAAPPLPPQALPPEGAESSRPAMPKPVSNRRYQSRTEAVDRAMSLGALVDRGLARAKAEKKGNQRGSIRALLPSLPTQPSLTTAWRALSLYRMSRETPEILRYRHLGIAHFGVLLGLPEPVRLEFARRAEYERWTRRKLEANTRHLRRASRRFLAGC